MKRTPHTHSMRRRAQRRPATNPIRSLAGAIALAMIAALLPLGLLSPAQAAIVGQGFTVTPADLAFILKQIKIAEYHAANTTEATGPCGALLGNGADQVGSPELSFGLRTVDGSCNNLQPGQETFGASDEAFPRLTDPVFGPADDVPAGFPGAGSATSYAQEAADSIVFDAQPRTVSNLIVDQTSTNPAAVAAAGFPVRSQGNEGVVPCTTDPSGADPDGDPNGCVPSHQTLSIPNITTDVGLSPPFNGLFTIFGQFFDHGLDKITNGGAGMVFVPLQDDDPLVAGPNHVFGDGDDLPANKRFMVLERGTIMTGPDGKRSAKNTDTPFIDQSQTYTSHASHQVFTREYVDNTAGQPVSTGKLLASGDGGLPTWAMVKEQAASLLGMRLVDTDVNDIPMIATDMYGKFIPGDLRGLPQYVTVTGLVEGDRASGGLLPPPNVLRIGTAFLNDIAHSAAPGTAALPKTADDDGTAGGSLDPVATGEYDDELLDLHFIAGDGRVNENIALSAVHQIFHSEHDRLVGDIKDVLRTDTSGITSLTDWQTALGAPEGTETWNGERLFQAARFVTEMEYQHLVFEEFARKVQPGINPFEAFAFNQTDVNPAITAEFAHAVYRFGHSMLTDSIDRVNANGSRNDISLFDGFLNPAAYFDGGPAGALSSQEAAGAIFMGMSDQVGEEIDEFTVDTLRNHLLGLPLDLPSINMARARSEGVPPLNNVRRQIFAATNDGQLKPYTDWVDFGQQLKHPESLVNFVAAYGTHPLIAGESTIVGRRTAADQIVNGTVLAGPDGILGADPSTALDDTAAIPAGPGPDGDFGTNCDTATPDPACADNTAEVPADPGPDGILGADPSTAEDDVNPPADAADFMFSTGVYARVGTTNVTGVDAIDLWVGGLAERTNLFGGLLGSTFNYVFENQLTNLQNGDRFYYLARTPGMNLRAQLEGNSFSELVMRNTNAHTLKADPFATADCKFELENITWPATSVGSSGKLITGTGSVQDDAASECDENEHLLRMADGTIRYRMTNTAMPSGINAQAVYNGKAGVVNDRIWGGADNDTFWGGEGRDIIEGGDGADVALGGQGNDIITDLAGDDVHKGGPGNDAIDAGPGLDIIMGGDGSDFTNGGANGNETFGGNGNDFAIAGQGTDAVFGDSGDDWEQGGDQPDLLIGDSSTLFFDDHNVPGHDILIGQGGDDDYDGEGGDDIFVAGPGVEKNAGASGFDWSIGKGDPQPQDVDLSLLIVNAPPVNEVRDRFNELEAISGWNLNDTIRGDDVVPSTVGGGGFIGCDVLDAAGVARITGLDALVPASIRTVDSAGVIAASATHHCRISGPVWGDGNILLGGSGSDVLEGRGANDIIDGDRYLNVRLSVRTDPTDPATETGTTDLMENKAKTGGDFGLGTTDMTLQQAVFAGLVDPGNIVAVREILSTPAADDVDVALFSEVRTNYEITLGDGFVTVAHTGGTATDGIDTLRNVEILRFAGTDVVVADIQAAAPAVALSLAALEFGAQATGTTGSTTLTVSNTGSAPLIVTDAAVTGADVAAFSVVTNGCTTISAAGSCNIVVAFTPNEVRLFEATLEIAHNAGGSTAVTLTGTGVAPPAVTGPTATVTDTDFGRRRAGTTRTQTVRVTNQGPGVLTVTGATFSGPFSLANLGTCAAPVAAGRRCTLNVTYTATVVGPETGTLSLVSNAANSPTATLTGTAR